jgi:hypothetical protein
VDAVSVNYQQIVDSAWAAVRLIMLISPSWSSRTRCGWAGGWRGLCVTAAPNYREAEAVLPLGILPCLVQALVCAVLPSPALPCVSCISDRDSSSFRQSRRRKQPLLSLDWGPAKNGRQYPVPQYLPSPAISGPNSSAKPISSFLLPQHQWKNLDLVAMETNHWLQRACLLKMKVMYAWLIWAAVKERFGC